ncbi:MAG: hypothetical protein QOH60_5075 [Mycobacterium sp.]|jgi:uncharacterized damage-inducible protein DinB|nr:hypothetical protein [Mycobacterium sp.]
MPALASPVTDERDALREFVSYHQEAYFAIAYGLTDEQARSTPSASAMSIGGVIKHITNMQKTWMQRVTAAPDAPTPDKRPFEERAAEFQDEFVMRDDETLAGLLDRFAAQNAKTLELVKTADLDLPVPVPTDAPWFPKDITHWSVRWVFFHVINELARHSGQADVIRESIDGATMYELIGGLEGWEETDWLKPWKVDEAAG